MPLGRPRAPGTEAERAEARRAKVRKNVQAFRRRQKDKKLADAAAQAVKTDDGYGGRVGSTICRQGYLDVSSSSRSDTPSVSARSSPGLGMAYLQTSVDYDYADPDSWIWRFPQDLLGNMHYQDTFTLAMQDADNWWADRRDTEPNPNASYEPFRALAGCGSTWFHVAMMETVDPGLEIMNEACLASALIVISREREDVDMGVSATYIQSRALRHLRESLQKWSEESTNLCPISLSLAALTCAMSEIVVSQSWPNFASHLNGVGCLLSYHDPATLTTQSARELFYGYRSLEAAFAFTHGRSMFLADPRWINMSWKDEVAMSRHPLHQMLDIAFQLLPELVEFQSYLDPSRKSASPPAKWASKATQDRIQHLQRTEEHQAARDRLRRLRSIPSELDKWEADFRAQQQQQAGGLHQRREAEWPGLYEYSFDFSSLAAATAYTMYTGIRIRLAEAIYTSLCICNDTTIVGTRPSMMSRGSSAPNINILAATPSTTDAMVYLMSADTASPPSSSSASTSTPTTTTNSQTEKLDALLQGLRWARQALQSLEFFHTGALKDCGWLTTLFAFDAAWAFVVGSDVQMHVELSKERRWCQQTARRFEGLGVPLLGWR